VLASEQRDGDRGLAAVLPLLSPAGG
jgi:hypothetical protein